MAERNEKVYDRVRQELGKNPNLGSTELYEQAKQMEKSIGQDTLQQFHARYVLPIKRQQASASGGGRRGRKGRTRKSKAPTTGGKTARKPGRRVKSTQNGGSDRDQIRTILLKFAQDLSAAETKSEVVKVMTRLDNYVSDIAAVGG